MTRTIKSTLISILLLAVVSCSHRGGGGFVIGVSQCSNDEWRELGNRQMSLEAEYYGFTVKILSAGDDTEAQKRDIDKLISEKVDILVVSPNESEGLTPKVTEAFQSGIPVILYDRITDNDQYTAFIGADNRQIGRMAAEYLAMMLSGKGNLLVVRGTHGSSADIERYEGLVEGLESVPDLKIAGEICGNFSMTEAYDAADDYFTRYVEALPAVDAIFALNDRMALGVYKAIDKIAGIGAIPPILGVDATTLGMNAIIEGKLKASFLYSPGGDQVIDLARRILLGEKYDKVNIMNTSYVDETNVRLMLSSLSQIGQNEEKIEELNHRVNDYNKRSSRRGMLLALTALLLVGVAVLLFYTGRASREKGRLVARLNEQNDHIQYQVDELEMQKNELVALSKQLEETTNAKLAFFTNISHEFKTPLSLINGPVEDLSAMKGMPAAAIPKLEILKRNNSKLSRLVGELLDFRTADTGNLNVNISTGDLGEFIEEIISLFDDVVARRNLKLVYEKTGNSSVIPFDPVKTEKIVTNFLSNAINHVDKCGTIRVRLDAEDSCFRISVFNSGSYIPESRRAQVFREFYTLDATQKGTGIGLALVNSLVNVMNGTIDLQSVEGEGTTFTVEIPIDRTMASDMEFDQASYRYSFARQKHDTIGEEYDNSGIYDDAYDGPLPVVLVIEDNIDMRQYLQESLSGEYHVILAKDGDVGVKKAQLFNPAIIISDIMMPGKDGYEVCRELRSREKMSNVPIILLTACAMDEQKARGYECGADGYMQKPFSVFTLKARMKSLLAKSEKIHNALNASFIPNVSMSGLSSDSVLLMEKIKKYVEEHITDQISMEDIIAHLGVSKSKFYRDVKEITEDYSPADVINLVRLGKSIEMMSSGKYSISEAAFACGFSSASYFSRTFHKYYNMSPSDYVKQHLA